jgi:RNA ligase (TIGR02306 family)
MSELKVQVARILEIKKHENADSLEIAKVFDWECVVQKDRYKANDLIIYIPIDSILSSELEEKIFGKDSKVKLHKSRVKAIKLRGVVSYGLIIDLDYVDNKYRIEGQDVTSILNITKYEPPQSLGPQSKCSKKSRKQINPYFKKYTDINNFKNYTNFFKDTDLVIINEKLHGSNARFAYLPTEASTLWKKFLKLIGKLPKYEYCVGSHNVQLQDNPKNKTYYGCNIYQEMFEKYNFKSILKPNMQIFGEVIGSGVQKNYSYGCKDGERRLVLFDLMIDGKYVDYLQFKEFCKTNNLPMVPELYIGKFNYEIANHLTKGNSVYEPTQKIREGVVIKTIEEKSTHLGRAVLKLISADYLLRKDLGDEFH